MVKPVLKSRVPKTNYAEPILFWGAILALLLIGLWGLFGCGRLSVSKGETADFLDPTIRGAEVFDLQAEATYYRGEFTIPYRMIVEHGDVWFL